MVKPQNCARCKYRCSRKLNADDRAIAHSAFWKLGSRGQQQFFGNTMKQISANSRNRSSYQGKKKFSISYYLIVRENKHQVCRDFYLKTLDISKSRIQTFHKNKDSSTELPVKKPRPINGKQYTKQEIKEIMDHIDSFPKVESHYCRANTEKKYLEPRLTIARMYNLYYAKQLEQQKIPVKEWKYSEIFNAKFNLDFHTPKKDRCDRCELFNVKDIENTLTGEQKEQHEHHRRGVDETRQARNTDKECADPTTLVVSFDLENIFALPKSDVSSHFYRRKMTTYNMTACVQRTKAYCAVWSENLSGCSGNDIASSIIAVLNKIVDDHPDCQNLVLWSDSCVPQNRNSLMSLALQIFVKERDLVSITQRFCEPGHSSIQDIDSVHSVIERSIRLHEVHSPLSLVRHLKNIKPNKQHMSITLLNKRQMLDYSESAKPHSYSAVKYRQAKELRYNQVKYSFRAVGETHQVIRPVTTRHKRTEIKLPTPVCSKVIRLLKEKVDDLKQMMPYMPAADREFRASVVG